MNFKSLALSLVVLLQIPLSALAHESASGEAGALKGLYEGMAKSFQALPVEEGETRDVAYLQYGQEKIPFRQSAFSSLIQQVILTEKIAKDTECHHCTHDHQSDLAWAASLRKFLTLKTIQISAFAYKGFRQYGVPYAIFFVLFEATEHTLFAWLPPMCPVYHAGYFAVSNFMRKFKIFFQKDSGLNLSEKARVVFTSSYLDVFFWSKLRTLSLDDPETVIKRGDYKSFSKYVQKNEAGSLFPTSDPIEGVLAKSPFWGEGWQLFHEHQALPVLNLEDDIDFIFSHADPAEKYWVATRQIKGFNLMLEFLNDIASERYEGGEISTRQVFKVYDVVGRLGRQLNNYKEDLRAYALASSPADLSSQRALALKKLAIIKSIFVHGQALIDEDGASLDGELRSLIVEVKSPFKNCLQTMATL